MRILGASQAQWRIATVNVDDWPSQFAERVIGEPILTGVSVLARQLSAGV